MRWGGKHLLKGDAVLGTAACVDKRACAVAGGFVVKRDPGPGSMEKANSLRTDAARPASDKSNFAGEGEQVAGHAGRRNNAVGFMAPR